MKGVDFLDFLYHIVDLFLDFLCIIAYGTGWAICILIFLMGIAVPVIIKSLGIRKKFPSFAVFSLYTTLAALMAVILKNVQFPTVF